MSEEGNNPEDNNLTPAQQFVDSIRVEISESLQEMLKENPDVIKKETTYPISHEHHMIRWLQGAEKYFNQVVESHEASIGYCETKRQDIMVKRAKGEVTEEDEADFKQVEKLLKIEQESS